MMMKLSFATLLILLNYCSDNATADRSGLRSRNGSKQSSHQDLRYLHEQLDDEERELISRDLAEITCGCARTCTADALNVNANGHTCGDRIDWLMEKRNKSEREACQIVADEYKDECGKSCNPSTECPKAQSAPANSKSDITCGCASTCTSEVLATLAGGHSCGGRIQYSMNHFKLDQEAACDKVASQYEDECGLCNSDPCPAEKSGEDEEITCGCASTCTEKALAVDANGYSCGSRISWLMKNDGRSERAACEKVATEFPRQCGVSCDPGDCGNAESSPASNTGTDFDFNCGCPTCDQRALNRPAPDWESDPSCGERMEWLMDNRGKTEFEACIQVSNEFRSDCGQCHPLQCEGAESAPAEVETITCGCEATCTQDVLSIMAGEYTCEERIRWVMSNLGKDEKESCIHIANDDYSECGGCNPLVCGRRLSNPGSSKLVWSDEFNYSGAPDSKKWGYDTGGGGWGNRELQEYTDDLENSYVSDGTLKIRAYVNSDGDYTSARLVTAGKAGWRYGRIRFRARLQKCQGRGTWPALWLLPEGEWKYGGWPYSGEIDVMEHVGYENGNYHSAVHTGAYNHLRGTQKSGHMKADMGWHIFEIIWTPKQIEYAMDLNPYFVFRNDGYGDSGTWPFDQRFGLIMNIAVGGFWGGAQGVDRDAFRGEGQILEVDWVRVYSL